MSHRLLEPETGDRAHFGRPALRRTANRPGSVAAPRAPVQKDDPPRRPAPAREPVDRSNEQVEPLASREPAEEHHFLQLLAVSLRPRGHGFR